LLKLFAHSHEVRNVTTRAEHHTEKCAAHGCHALGSERIEVGFNELTPAGLAPRNERLWLCAEHAQDVAREILSSDR